MRSNAAVLVTLFTLLATLGHAAAESSAYTKSAGQNAPTKPVSRSYQDEDGVFRTRIEQERVNADSFGNAQGNDHDLAIDGAFEGQTVAVIQLYTIDFDFSLPKAALKEKGFSVYRWVNTVPTPAELENGLEKSSQLWIIADSSRHLTDDHVRVIKKFFDAGHGVYIWGDNQPYYADANVVAEALLDGASMEGDLIGDQVVGVRTDSRKPGVLPNHLLTTGLEHLYEGITIATIKPGRSELQPLLHGSAGNLVAAYYDQGGRRAILDGGFTRLYNKWDTAGTARYVKNAAAWLVNAERFGDAVVAPSIRSAAVIAAPAPMAVAPAPTMGTVSRPSPSLATNAIGLGLVLLMTSFLLLLYVPGLSRRD
jgi:hypothetical protein